MKSGLRSVSLMLAVVLVCLQAATMAQQEKGYSHVRVVRLSFVDGMVLVKRPGAAEWAKASVNTPIEEGFSISTGDKGFAEVEFENGSTARLGQLSQIDFSELALAPDGAKINQLTFDHGYATFKLAPAKHEHDIYSIKVGQTTLKPEGKAEFRTDLNNGQLRVEVLEGSVEATSLEREAKLTKNKVLAMNSEEAFDITSGIQKDDWDDWVHARDVQTELAYNDSAVGAGSPTYGWTDLDEYGEWGYFPGFGYAWSPFTAAGWSPFSMGQWSYYPGFGYTWISSEPWGWLPFHYGYWNYSPSYGYLWFPGSMNSFYPGLVTWYQGPDYYGWAPMGRNGTPACNPSMAGCVTAVGAGTLQNGSLVNTATRIPVNPVVLNRISNPSLTPGAMAMLSGRPVSEGTVYPGGPVATRSVPVGSTPNMARVATPSYLAPRIILMGQNPAQGTKMEAQLDAHRSFLSRTNTRQPLVVHMGNTLGGRYTMQPMSGNAVTNRGQMNAGFNGQSPVFLSHRAATGFSAPLYQVRGGTIRMQNSGGMRSVEESGGYRGSAVSAPTGNISSSRMSAPVSVSHTVSAPAGPHR